MPIMGCGRELIGDRPYRAQGRVVIIRLEH